jgi:hypothetical protein
MVAYATDEGQQGREHIRCCPAATRQLRDIAPTIAEAGRSAILARVNERASARDRLLGRDSASREYVALEVAVIALRCADIRVTELALYVHQRVAGGQPGGLGRSANELGMRGRIGQRSCLE